MAAKVSRAEVLLHPVRLRVVQTLAAMGKATVGELAQALDDVPAPTLYRHVNKLASAGLLEVVGKRRVRGTIEKTFALEAAGANLSPDDIAGADVDTHGRWFLTFALGLHDKLTRVLQGSVEAGKGIDFVRDGIGYHAVPLWLDDDELKAMSAELNAVVHRYLQQGPGGGRRLRSLSTVLMPEPDVPPAATEERGVSDAS
jgi:DNA-binding transcriptional ArsR family regulator